VFALDVDTERVFASGEGNRGINLVLVAELVVTLSKSLTAQNWNPSMSALFQIMTWKRSMSFRASTSVGSQARWRR
jgi:hypothetical protein